VLQARPPSRTRSHLASRRYAASRHRHTRQSARSGQWPRTSAKLREIRHDPPRGTDSRQLRCDVNDLLHPLDDGPSCAGPAEIMRDELAATDWPTRRSAPQAPQLSPRTAPRYARSTRSRRSLARIARPRYSSALSRTASSLTSGSIIMGMLSPGSFCQKRRNLMIVQRFSKAWNMWTAATTRHLRARAANV
jgi:hypothetical protein